MEGTMLVGKDCVHQCVSIYVSEQAHCMCDRAAVSKGAHTHSLRIARARSSSPKQKRREGESIFSTVQEFVLSATELVLGFYLCLCDMSALHGDASLKRVQRRVQQRVEHAQLRIQRA